MLDTLDAPAVRAWCHLALNALGQAREEIDAINVYPVPDGDTGTNLYLTVESAAQAVEAVFSGHAAVATGALGELPAFADVVRAMAHGALIGARGNSGVILAQLLRGMSEVLAPDGVAEPCGAVQLGQALRRAAASAYEAVARPVEGTVLTVAAAAADAADAACHTAADLPAVAHAAYEGARTALASTPRQLDVLAEAGVVDAGGRGLVAVLGALADAVAGDSPMGPLSLISGHRAREGQTEGGPAVRGRARPECHKGDPHAVPGGPAFEVVYLLEAPDSALPELRSRLDTLGDSLVVVGGGGLWNVHVHVDDAGAAVEAGIEAGKPYRIRITHFGVAPSGIGEQERLRPAPRGIVAVVGGDGLARLYAEAGATVLLAEADQSPASGDLAEAVRRTRAREVVLLPNDTTLRSVAAVAVERARQDGVRVALIPTRSAVQGIAALAVHEVGRRFDEDVVAMTAAAGATRFAELAIAESQSWTMAGVCQAGDVLGLIDGDVAVIGHSLEETAWTVLDRMLAAGGEMVTLVLGADAPDSLAIHLQRCVRDRYVAVDSVVYHGGQESSPLLLGVE